MNQVSRFNVLTLILLFLLLSSCSKRVEFVDQTEVKREIMFSAQFNTGAISLRSTSERAQRIAGDLRRIVFEGVRVVFYSVNETGEPQIVKYVFDKDINYKDKILSGKDAAEVSERDGSLNILIGGMVVEANDYKVLIIFNPSEEFKRRTELNSDFTRLREDFTQGAYTDQQRLMMTFYTNAESLVTLSKSQLIAQNTSNPLSIQTELTPNHAFASIYWNAENVPDDHSVSTNEIRFYTDVANKKFRLFPEYASITTDGGEVVKYPVDCNYGEQSKLSDEELKKEFLYLDETVTGPVWNKTIRLNVGDKFHGYAIAENTMEGSDTHAKTVTRLLVGIPYSPNSSIPLGSDWLSIDGTNYSVTAFLQSITQIKRKTESSRTATERRLLTVHDMLSAKFGNTLMDANFGYSGDGIQCYKGGYAYYAIPIRHLSDSQVREKKKTGRYGVVRNTLYMINISRFSAPGYGDPRALPRDFQYDNNGETGTNIMISPPGIVEYSVEL